MGKTGIDVWSIEQRGPLASEFAYYGIKVGSESEAIAEASALLVENGGSAVEVRYRPTSTLGIVWRYIPQFIENRPRPTDSGLDNEWPEWLGPESEYTSAGAEALRRRRRVNFARYTPICKFCGARFGASRFSARFCSARCRQADYRRRTKKASTPESRAEAAQKGIETKRSQSIKASCAVCESDFWIDGTQTAAIYCSPACRQKAYRERKKAERLAAELEFLRGDRCST